MNVPGSRFRQLHGIGHYIVYFYRSEWKLVIELDGDSHFSEQALQPHPGPPLDKGKPGEGQFWIRPEIPAFHHFQGRCNSIVRY
ncbi:DUF559 domain-containing protein [Candidatus Thalassolituus haligoni]|uniref:DUF559 domain-containing protein n=1 Tax=Candidatus Thalassolituus haligoni TaxID=3100113 RepID=UPI00351223A0